MSLPTEQINSSPIFGVNLTLDRENYPSTVGAPGPESQFCEGIFLEKNEEKYPTQC
jgi:hypothetical protein